MRATSRRLKTGIICVQLEQLTVTRHTIQYPSLRQCLNMGSPAVHKSHCSRNQVFMTKGVKMNSRKQLLNSCLNCNEEKIKKANLDSPLVPGRRNILTGPSLTILLHSCAYIDQGSACWKGLKNTEIQKNKTDSYAPINERIQQVWHSISNLRVNSQTESKRTLPFRVFPDGTVKFTTFYEVILQTEDGSHKITAADELESG
jgi:hypothetical protein